MRPIASLPLIPTVPSEPLLLATTATLPLSDLISEAAPAPAAVISACEPRYCWALPPLARDARDAVGSLIQPRPPCVVLFRCCPDRRRLIPIAVLRHGADRAVVERT